MQLYAGAIIPGLVLSSLYAAYIIIRTLLSPPVAMVAFYLKGISPPEVLLSEIYWGMMPFMALQILGRVITYFFPPLTTWLPKLVFG